MLVHRRVTPRIKFDGTHVKHLGGERHYRVSLVPPPRAQHNVPARDGHRTAGSGDERTNQEATAPPHDHDDAIFTTRWVYVTFPSSPPLSAHVNMTDSS